MCTHRVNSSVQYHISLLKRSHLTHSGWGESSLNAKRPAGAHKRRGLIFWGCCLKWNVRNTPSASTWVTWMEDYPATISSHHIRVLQDEMCGRSTHPAVFSWFPDPPTSQFPCFKSKQHTHTHTHARRSIFSEIHTTSIKGGETCYQLSTIEGRKKVGKLVNRKASFTYMWFLFIQFSIHSGPLWVKKRDLRWCERETAGKM